MSLHLGKIHYWLYNKIKWAEKIEADIMEWAKTKDIGADQLGQEAVRQYGERIGDKLLEDEIDAKNIHGWLQGRIESVELRLAYIVTTIIDANPELTDDIIGLFEDQGREAALMYDQNIHTPEEAFNALNDFMLEGMPCDRVNEMISSDASKYSWRTKMCLHQPYWDQVKGDISIFYVLRDAWVKVFIGSLTPKFKYIKTDELIHEIIRL